jgi:hypothetical protein
VGHCLAVVAIARDPGGGALSRVVTASGWSSTKQLLNGPKQILVDHLSRRGRPRSRQTEARCRHMRRSSRQSKFGENDGEPRKAAQNLTRQAYRDQRVLSRPASFLAGRVRGTHPLQRRHRTPPPSATFATLSRTPSSTTRIWPFAGVGIASCSGATGSAEAVSKCIRSFACRTV